MRETTDITSRTFETLLLSRSDSGVVTITMNRPQKKNAADGAMWRELLHAFSAVGDDPRNRCVVLTGAGGDFCSGADLSGEVDEEVDQPHRLDSMAFISRVCLSLHRVPIPVIARVDGVAVGAGLNMALGCDLIICSERARFSEIFARRGLSIDFGGSWVLPRLIGMHRAKELTLLGDIITAREAERLGLVNRVVPLDELDTAVDAWAERMADGPPLELKMSKRLLSDSYSCSLQEALDAEAMAQTVNFASADTAEAMMAFLEKRDPKFRGR